MGLYILKSCLNVLKFFESCKLSCLVIKVYCQNMQGPAQTPFSNFSKWNQPYILWGISLNLSRHVYLRWHIFCKLEQIDLQSLDSIHVTF